MAFASLCKPRGEPLHFTQLVRLSAPHSDQRVIEQLTRECLRNGVQA